MLYNIFFSPTGGTKKVADCICAAMDGHTAAIDLIGALGSVTTFSGEDVCVISVPSYGGRVPGICVERISSLRGGGARAVLVAVFGNRAIDDTLAELYDIVTAGGFRVVAAVEAVAEHSLARMYACGRPDAADRAELEMFAGSVADKLRAGNINEPVVPGSRPYRDYSPSPMSPVLDRTCIGCKKCALECPAGAISLSDVSSCEPDKCISCLRCVSVCPVHARHNSEDEAGRLEKLLSKCCAGRRENRLYI